MTQPVFGELTQAIQDKDIEKVRALLELGADVNEEFLKAFPPMEMAVDKGLVVIAGLLIEHDADVDKKDREGAPLLIDAVQNNDLEMVLLLLDSGANVNATDQDGWTALHYSSLREPRLEIMRLLVERGADIAIRTMSAKTALALVKERKCDSMEMLLNEAPAIRRRYLESVKVRNEFQAWKQRRVSHDTAVRNQQLSAATGPDYVIRRRPQP